MQQSRIKINEIDKEIARLFNERFKVVKEIKKYKKLYNLPIADKEREKALLRENIKLIDEEFSPYFIKFYETLMTLSKEYQK
ncbi:MAG: chorismate mutase [Acholeplasmatales bacterium]